MAETKVTINGETDGGGAWVSWTPTFVNLSGGTLSYAKYKRIGNTINLKLAYTMTGANISGSVTFTLPVTAIAANSTATIIGEVNSVDMGTAVYFGSVTQSSTTVAQLRVLAAAGAYTVNTGLSATVPFTWGAGDSLEAVCTYEAAA